MTLPPLEGDLIRGIEGPFYKVGPNCSNPTCRRFAEHGHHIFRRTDQRLGRPYDWIQIGDWVVANRTGVCPWCHDDLTGRIGGHRAAIRIDLGKQIFNWCLVTSENGVPSYQVVGPITPQPPTPELLAERDPGEEESERCPTCGHRRGRQSPTRPGSRRPRKTWLVKVPVDAIENGAEVLDSLVENIAPLCPSGDSSSTGRYYVLVPVLAYALMDTARFVKTMEGVGG